MSDRFTILKENHMTIRDWAEGKNYTLIDPKQALSLCQLLNMMNETVGRTFRPETAIPQQS